MPKKTYATMTGYQAFSKEEHIRLVTERPELKNNFGTLCKAVGKSWSALKPTEKQEWKEKAEKLNSVDQDRMVKTYEKNYGGRITTDEEHVKKKKPYRLTAYLYFQRTERKRIVAQYRQEDLPDFGTISKLVGQAWQHLTDTERKSYATEAKQITSRMQLDDASEDEQQQIEEVEEVEIVIDDEGDQLSEGEVPGPSSEKELQDADATAAPFPVTLIKVDRAPQPNTYQLPDKTDMLSACKPEGGKSSVKVVYTCTPLKGTPKSPVKNTDQSSQTPSSTSVGQTVTSANKKSAEKEKPTKVSLVTVFTPKPVTLTPKPVTLTPKPVPLTPKPATLTQLKPTVAAIGTSTGTVPRPVVKAVTLPLNSIDTARLAQNIPIATKLAQLASVNPGGITLQNVNMGTKLPSNSTIVFGPGGKQQIIRFQGPTGQPLILGQNAQLLPASGIRLQAPIPTLQQNIRQPSVRILTPQQFEELKRSSPYLFKAVANQLSSTPRVIPGGVPSPVPGKSMFVLRAPLPSTSQSGLLSVNSFINSTARSVTTSTATTANTSIATISNTSLASISNTSLATITNTAARANNIQPQLRSPSPPRLKSISPVHQPKHKEKIPDAPPVLTIQPPQPKTAVTTTATGPINGRTSPGTAHYTIHGNTIRSVPLNQKDSNPSASDLCNLELPNKPMMRVAFRPMADKKSAKRKMEEAEVDGPIYTCNFCMVAFTDNEALKAHFLSKHTDDDYNTDPMPFKCYFCDVKYGEKSQLTEHMKRVHDGNKELKRIKLPDTAVETSNNQPIFNKVPIQMNRPRAQQLVTKPFFSHAVKSTESYSVSCVCCELHFPSKRDLCIHKLKKHVDIFNPSMSMTVEHSVASQVTVDGTFKTINQDVIHRTTFCLSCGFPCKTNSELGVHIYEAHQGIYVCPGADCERLFKERRCLKWHISVAHPKFRAYSCKFCSFCTYHQLGALRHLNVHTLESRMKEAEILTKQLEKDVIELDNEPLEDGQKKGQIQIGAVEEDTPNLKKFSRAKKVKKTGQINIGPVNETLHNSKKKKDDVKNKTKSKTAEVDMLNSDLDKETVGYDINDDDHGNNVESMEANNQPYVYIERFEEESAPLYPSDSSQSSPPASPTEAYAPGSKRPLSATLPSNPPPAKKISNNKTFRCLDCKQSFPSRDALTSHFSYCGTSPVVESSPPAAVKCNLCFSNFKSVQALKSHRRCVHFKPAALNQLSCKKCDIAFSDKSHLSRHLNAKHPK